MSCLVSGGGRPSSSSEGGGGGGFRPLSSILSDACNDGTPSRTRVGTIGSTDRSVMRLSLNVTVPSGAMRAEKLVASYSRSPLPSFASFRSIWSGCAARVGPTAGISDRDGAAARAGTSAPASAASRAGSAMAHKDAIKLNPPILSDDREVSRVACLGRGCAADLTRVEALEEGADRLLRVRAVGRARVHLRGERSDDPAALSVRQPLLARYGLKPSGQFGARAADLSRVRRGGHLNPLVQRPVT